MSALIALVIAYLLGSVSTAIILAKALKLPDPRTTGSGNAGATNMLRISGKKEAALVLVGDGLKGLLAIWIGHVFFHLQPMILGLVGLAAVAGHIYPIYFKFKGGKGVATAIGAVLGLSFLSGILMIAAWAAIAFTTRYSSLASMITMILGPIFLIFFSAAGMAYFIPTALIAALVIWKHKENIQRLKTNTESKIEF